MPVEAALVGIRGEAFIPSLFILYFSALAISPFVTWVFKSKKTGWGSFWSVWFSSAVILGIIVGILAMAPEFTTNSITKFVEFFRL